MKFTTSLLYDQYNGDFLHFRSAWLGEYFDPRDELDSFKSKLRARTLQYLDHYVRELEALGKSLKEYEKYVLDKTRDIIPQDSEQGYFQRQRQYLVYKTLRDMFKDTYVEEYPSNIDRDGDWIMIFWDIAEPVP